MAKFVRLISLLALVLSLVCCERDGLQLNVSVGPYSQPTRKVMLLYEAGFNSLGGELAGNINTLKKGYLPGGSKDDDVLLVMSHLPKVWRNYVQPTSPSLVRIYQEHGIPVTDTLMTWPAGTSLANKEMVTEVLSLVRERFPAAGYGVVFSSHATGWMPAGYFSNPKEYEGHDRSNNDFYFAPRIRRSFGQEFIDAGTKTEEIEIFDLAAAIPYRLDYILFDACLMGTVEVAWELRNVCDYVAASPCEIPAAGFDYSTLAGRLLQPEVPDVQGVCADYFARYENDSVYGATITLVDCRSLDPLATVCRNLFDAYRQPIRTLSGANVQTYDRLAGQKGYYAFFDLKDILREAGASDEELAALQEALDEAIVYEAHTKRFISLELKRCCGLAMYLPAYPDYRSDRWHGTSFLDNFYKTHLAWNTATSLVE